MMRTQYLMILRINEVLKIRWTQDIDIRESDQVFKIKLPDGSSVTKKLTIYGRIFCRASKNDDCRWRDCYDKKLIQELQDYCSKNVKVGELVFPISTTMGERIVLNAATEAKIQRSSTRIVKTKGLQSKYEVTSHSLRAAGVTHAIQNGANPEAIRQYGGWKSRAAFERYVKQITTAENISLLHLGD